jgi:hypothetical protein
VVVVVVVVVVAVVVVVVAVGGGGGGGGCGDVLFMKLGPPPAHHPGKHVGEAPLRGHLQVSLDHVDDFLGCCTRRTIQVNELYMCAGREANTENVSG